MEMSPIIKTPVGSKARRYTVCLFMGLASAFGIFVFLIYLGMSKPPKESILLQDFYKNRAAFEQLRDMLEADARLRRVANWGVEISQPFFLGYPSPNVFPVERFKQYLALLKQTGGRLA